MNFKRKHLPEQGVILTQQKFCWEIKSWKDVIETNDEYFRSNIVNIKMLPFLSIQLSLDLSSPNDFLIFGFKTMDATPQKYAVEVFLINNDSKILWSSKFSNSVLSYDSPVKSFPKIDSKQIIGQIIKDNKMTLVCHTTITMINVIQIIPSNVLIDLVEHIEQKKKLKFDMEKDKFEEIINNNSENFSDIILKVGGHEIYAHKIIIANKSPVFADMFKNIIKDKQNTVNIIGIQFPIIKEMLRFIYTGQVEKIDEVAEKLLEASDKYGIEGLKMICERVLAEKISNQNLLAMADLAKSCNAKVLEEKIIDFIVENKRSLVSTQEFKGIACTQPEIMVKVCTKWAFN